MPKSSESFFLLIQESLWKWKDMLPGTFRTTLHDRFFLFHRRAAGGTKAAVSIPMQNLMCFSCCLIMRQRKIFIGGTKPYHDPLLRFFNGRGREKALQFFLSSVVILCTVVFSLITIGELSPHGMAYMASSFFSRSSWSL